MRTVSKWVLTILFILLLPAWLLLLVPKLNDFGADSVKYQLQQHHVYEQFSQLLQQTAVDANEQPVEITDQALVVFRSALTPAYIEGKSVEVIDESSAWLTGHRDQPPAVSFNDIKEEVIASYPAAQQQIDDLTGQLKQSKQQLEDRPISADGIPGLEGDGSTSTIEIAEMLKQADSLDNFAAGDFRLDLGHLLQPAKQVFEAYSLALPLLGIVLLLLLTAMFALGRNWPSRLKWVGWVLVISGVGNALSAIIFSIGVLHVGADVLIGMIPEQFEAGGSLVSAMITSLFADYLQLEMIMSGILLVVGLLAIASGIMVHKRSGPKAGSLDTPPDTTSQAISQDRTGGSGNDSRSSTTRSGREVGSSTE